MRREERSNAPRPRELLLATALYLALALWWLWPLPLALATHAGYALQPDDRMWQGADWYLIAWALAWGVHAFFTQPLRFFDANAFHPAPLSLAYSEHFLGHQPLFAPAYLLTDNAVFAVNFLLLGMFTFSALGFFALARRFVGGPAAFVGGMLFSFSPFRHENLIHFHLLGVQYLPLALLFTERWFEGARRRDACLLSVVLLLQALSSVYLGFALALLYTPYVGLAAWRWRGQIDRRRLLGLAIVGAITVAVMAVVSSPYVRLARLGLIPSYGSPEYGPAVGVVFSRRVVVDYLTRSGVGVCGYVLVLVGLLPRWRGRGWPIVIGIVSVVTGTLVACGAHGLSIGSWTLPAPYPWLARVLPPVGAIRLPARVVIIAHFGLCLLAALGMHRLVARARGGLAWTGATVVVVGLLVSFPPLPAPGLHATPACADAPDLQAWLARHGEGRPLLELPGTSTPAVAARRMYLSACHWLPTAGGYSAYPPRIADVVYDAADGLPHAQALQRLVDTIDVGWIVVHLDELSPAERGRWNTPLAEGLEEAVRFAGVRVLRVTRAPGPGDRRSRLFAPSQTLGGVPLEPLGATCPGRLEILEPLPRLRRGGKIRVRLGVTNLGESPWPGFGLIPRHLVHLRACITSAGTPCQTAPKPLGIDVPAGSRQVAEVEVSVPSVTSGQQELRVELWQLGDGPLERCGTPPAAIAVRMPVPSPPVRDL